MVISVYFAELSYKISWVTFFLLLLEELYALQKADLSGWMDQGWIIVRFKNWIAGPVVWIFVSTQDKDVL